MSKLILILITIRLAWALSPECSDRGFYNGTTCSCIWGYYLENCSLDVSQLLPVGWTFYVVFMSVIFLTFIVMYTALLARKLWTIWRRHQDTRENYANIMTAFARVELLVLSGAYIFSWTGLLLYAIDMQGFRRLYHFAVEGFLYGVNYPIFVSLYMILLIYWRELLRRALYVIDQETKKMRINSTYNPIVTVEDIVNKLDSRKCKYLILVLFPFVFIIEGIRNAFYVTQGPIPVSVLWVIIMTIIIFSLSVGFLYYGLKLKKILPREYVPVFRRATIILVVQTALFCGMWISLGVTFLVTNPGPNEFIIIEFLHRCFHIITLAGIFYFFVSGRSQQDTSLNSYTTDSGNCRNSDLTHESMTSTNVSVENKEDNILINTSKNDDNKRTDMLKNVEEICLEIKNDTLKNAENISEEIKNDDIYQSDIPKNVEDICLEIKNDDIYQSDTLNSQDISEVKNNENN